MPRCLDLITLDDLRPMSASMPVSAPSSRPSPLVAGDGGGRGTASPSCTSDVVPLMSAGSGAAPTSCDVSANSRRGRFGQVTGMAGVAGCRSRFQEWRPHCRRHDDVRCCRAASGGTWAIDAAAAVRLDRRLDELDRGPAPGRGTSELADEFPGERPRRRRFARSACCSGGDARMSEPIFDEPRQPPTPTAVVMPQAG